MREDKERAIATFTVELDEVRESEAFFRKACQQKEKEYQALMDEQLDGFTELEKLKTELKQANSELKARDRSLDNLQKQLEEKEQAIANLKTQLEEYLLEAPEQTTPGILQPEKLKKLGEHSPAVETEAAPPDMSDWVEVERKGLKDYIDKKDPAAKISEHDITDAVRDRHKPALGSDKSRLELLEEKYNFKHIGKVGGRHKFKVPKLPEQNQS